jgi:putative transposase
MKKRFTEDQIIQTLEEIRQGKAAKEVARQKGITLQTIYTWKTKYGDMSADEARKLKALEAENARLKRLVADLSLDNQILKDVNSKKW